MKKRKLKKEKLVLKKFKVSKLENLKTIKGGATGTGSMAVNICGGSGDMVCFG